MKRFILVLLAALATYGLTGCALTDYCDGPNCSARLTELGLDNKALGCNSNLDWDKDGVPDDQYQYPSYGPPVYSGKPQRPVPGLTSDVWVSNALSFLKGQPNIFAGLCRTNCTFQGCLGATSTVTLAEAQAWQGKLGAQVFLGEAQVFSPVTLRGTYVLGGVKSLGTTCDPATGQPKVSSGLNWLTIRLNSFYSPVTGNFSCVGDGVDGLYGAPETSLLGDSAARIPGLVVDAVALDNGPTLGWGSNIAAYNPNGYQPAGSPYRWQTFWAILGRAYEGRHEFVMPSAGLAEFLSGQPLTVNAPNNIPATFTISGSVRPDGMIAIALEEMSYEGRHFRPSQPIHLAMDRNMRKWELGLKGVDQTPQLRELARWASDNIDLTRSFRLGGLIPELGLILPDSAVLLNAEGIAHFGKGPKLTGGQKGSGGRSR